MTLIDAIQLWITDKPQYGFVANCLICSKCTVTIVNIHVDCITSWGWGHATSDNTIRAADPELFIKIDQVMSLHPCEILRNMYIPAKISLAS